MKQFWHLVGQTVKLSVSAMFHVWLQTILQAFFRSFEWKWLAKQRGQSVTIHFSQSGLWSSKLPRSPEMIGAMKASPFQWSEVRHGRMWWCCQWPPPAPRAWPSHHVWVPPMSRRPSYYWHFLPVAVRLITLYFCQSSVTWMINVEFYVTQADKSSKGLMFTSFGRTLTNEMTHVMSKISRELLDFVSLEQGKYQNTRETCCWVESHAGDVLLLFPVPF